MILAVIASSIGIAINRFDYIEQFRSEIAVWLLISLGLTYFICGIRGVLKKQNHEHLNYCCSSNNCSRTTLILFIISILGPCEPLIPLIMYPVIQKSILNIFLISFVFGLSTLFVMLFMVFIFIYGSGKIAKITKFSLLEKYGNVLTGGIICTCGLVVKFFGI